MSNKKGICPYFLKGCCRFGDKCKNSHDTQMSDDSQKSSDQPAPTSFNNDQNLNQSKNTCRFYLQDKCTNKACTYFHGYNDRLKHLKKINEHKNEINNFVKMDDTKFISSDCQDFYVRNISENVKDYKETINQEYKIGKIIFSSNNVICAIQKEGM